ncbi:MAG: hypothetical protein AAGA96_14560 [Verrucomicrobiota bacterium]
MTKKKYYIRLDVHKKSVAIAFTSGGSRSTLTYFTECGRSAKSSHHPATIDPRDHPVVPPKPNPIASQRVRARSFSFS